MLRNDLGWRIETASRLHLGLLSFSDDEPRIFGGLGLMIAEPRVVIEAGPSPDWSAEGPQADRVLELAKRVSADLSLNTLAKPVPLAFRVIALPAPHTGLGVGTQLALATARLVAVAQGCDDVPLERLARITGRGRRSAIGFHGFQAGGFLVDGGIRRDRPEVPAPRLFRADFPLEWRILVVNPPCSDAIADAREIEAFKNLPAFDPGSAGRMCKIVLLEILPALIEHDLKAFQTGVSALQDRVGACFAPAQGGKFRSPQAAAIAAELGRLGLGGIGQSSWGPAIYAFAGPETADLEPIALELANRFSLPESDVFITRADNHGARIRTRSQ